MSKTSLGKLLLASAVGVVLALLTPVTLFAISPVLLIPVLAVWLYAWAGAIPALVYAAGSTALFGVVGGGVFAIACFLALFVPAAVSLAAIRARKSYVACMCVSIPTQIAALLLAMFAGWLALRVNLIDALTARMGETLTMLPGEMTDQMLMLFGQLGVLGESAIDYSRGVLTEAERASAISLYINAITQALKLQLPSLALTSSVATGIATIAVPEWIWARKGDDRSVRRVPLADWRVPRNAALGLPLCLALAYILYRMQYNGGDSVYLTTLSLCQLMCSIQALGAVSRMAKKQGMSRLMRVILILLLLWTSLSVIIGAFSLYFGSQGIVSSAIRKRMKNNGGEE